MYPLQTHWIANGYIFFFTKSKNWVQFRLFVVDIVWFGMVYVQIEIFYTSLNKVNMLLSIEIQIKFHKRKTSKWTEDLVFRNWNGMCVRHREISICQFLLISFQLCDFGHSFRKDTHIQYLVSLIYLSRFHWMEKLLRFRLTFSRHNYFIFCTPVTIP